MRNNQKFNSIPLVVLVVYRIYNWQRAHSLSNPDTYKEDSKELFDKIVQQLGHVGNMSPTVQRVLVHGHEFLYWAKEIGIPLGRFSESAIEYRNKDRRKARLKFSRKNSRKNNTTDMYHYLIKTSDPIVKSI